MATGSQRIRRRGVLLDGSVEGDPRCAACDGACCRSFPSVPLTWHEYRRLLALGASRLFFTPSGAWLVIENGCEFLEESRCRIYASRPAVCRRFTCADGPERPRRDAPGPGPAAPPMPLA